MGSVFVLASAKTGGERPRQPMAAAPASGPPGSQPTETLDDFDFTVLTSVSRQLIAHVAQLDFLAAFDDQHSG